MKKYLFNKERHLHTLGGQMLTGTSSVSNVIAKPLTWYASGLACEAFGIPSRTLFKKIKMKTISEQEQKEMLQAVTAKLAELQKMSVENYVLLLDTAYRAHDTYKKEKAEEGTDLHQTIEDYIKAEMKNEMIASNERIIPFVEWSKKNVKRWLWSETHCYSEKYWLGGICDIGAEMTDGSYILMDAKSAKAAYPNMFIQPALYDLQISENGGFTFDGERMFTLDKPITKYAIIPFGAEKIEPFIREDVENCKTAALAALELYRFLPRE